jgi:hypothetical protein
MIIYCQLLLWALQASIQYKILKRVVTKSLPSKSLTRQVPARATMPVFHKERLSIKVLIMLLPRRQPFIHSRWSISKSINKLTLKVRIGDSPLKQL